MMHDLIKRFIIWYLLKKCNAKFEYHDKVVRVFSAEFHEKHIKEYCNAMKRSNNNESECKM